MAKKSSCACNECYTPINVETQSHIVKDERYYCSSECLQIHLDFELKLEAAAADPFNENRIYVRKNPNRYSPSDYREEDELG